MVALDEGEEAVDEERVGDGLGRVVSPDTSSGLEISLGHFFGFLLRAFFAHTGFGELGFEFARVDLLRLGLLLLLQCARVELAIRCGRGRFFVLAAFGVLRLLGLLLLRQALE